MESCHRSLTDINPSWKLSILEPGRRNFTQTASKHHHGSHYYQQKPMLGLMSSMKPISLHGTRPSFDADRRRHPGGRAKLFAHVTLISPDARPHFSKLQSQAALEQLCDGPDLCERNARPRWGFQLGARAVTLGLPCEWE